MKSFPMLGFPGETNRPRKNIVYRCYPTPSTLVCVWPAYYEGEYQLNIYHANEDEFPTSVEHRLSPDQEPLSASDPFEVQCLIFHLIQTHLPSEVTA
jgi:hypothetical protein